MKDEKALKALYILRKYCRQKNCPDCIFSSEQGFERICFIAANKEAPAYWKFTELNEKVNGTKATVEGEN